MALTADFSSCSKKCRCCHGENKGLAYDCENPCSIEGEEFDSATCTCSSVYGKTTWRIEGYEVSADSCSFNGETGVKTCGPPIKSYSFGGVEITTSCGRLPHTAIWSNGNFCEPTGDPSQCLTVNIASVYIIQDADGNEIGSIGTNSMALGTTCNWTTGHCPAAVDLIFTQECSTS